MKGLSACWGFRGREGTLCSSNEQSQNLTSNGTHWELATSCNEEVLEQLLGHLPIGDVDASRVDPQGAGKGEQEGSLLSAEHLVGHIDQLLKSLQVGGVTLSVLHPTGNSSSSRQLILQCCWTFTNFCVIYVACASVQSSMQEGHASEQLQPMSFCPELPLWTERDLLLSMDAGELPLAALLGG